jgi:hypothetical protein
LATASSTCRLGTISPAANVVSTNLPSVSSPTMRATVCAAPNSVSKLLGKLEVKRHFTFSLVCWAKAGDAASVASAAAGANCRRVMVMTFPPLRCRKV